MANVLFKRGLQNKLPGSTSASDGVFYLTTDTNRLYVGQGNDLKLLNQTVQIVDSVTSLQAISSSWDATAAHSHINDFFYCSNANENILVVWTGNRWQQINKNTDTVISGAEFDVSTTTGGVVVDYSITQAEGGSSSVTSAQFAIKGAGGITVANSDNNITLTGNEYSLSRDVTNNVATIILGSNNLSTTSSVALKAGDNVTLAATGSNQIAISAVDTVISGAELSVNNGTVQLEITQNDGANSSVTTATVTSVGVIVGENNGYYLPIASTVGKSAGTVYTKAEIDTLINGLDGMTYRGTIASTHDPVATVHSLPTTAVQRGDVYVVSNNKLTEAMLGTTVAVNRDEIANGTFRIGDMFIASGTEDNDGYISSVQWTYIPSGNDSADQFTYHAEADTSTNSIEMRTAEDGNPLVMGITLASSTGIVISSTQNTAGNAIISTIGHATVATTSTTSTAASTTSFSAISSISIDNGHITSYNVETFETPSYGFTDTRAATLINSDVVNGTRMATATNSGANDLTVATNLLEGSTPISSSIIKFSSSSIKLSASENDGEVVMNMEWGTF